MFNFTINVTEKHIANGKPLNSQNCPVALAIKSHWLLRFCRLVFVCSRSTQLSFWRLQIAFKMPEEVRVWINTIDGSMGKIPMQPISFSVRPAFGLMYNRRIRFSQYW